MIKLCQNWITVFSIQCPHNWRLRFSSDADNVRLTNVCIIIIIIEPRNISSEMCVWLLSRYHYTRAKLHSVL